MTETQRLPELDALRGLAVPLMVLYHTAFDLRFFYGWPLDVFHGKWLLLARTAAILFLLIAGMCFALSWERTPPPRRFRKIARRFLILALATAIVSLATWLIAPQDFVKFGILHLFALATLLLPLFAPLKRWNALIGLLILSIPALFTVPTIPTIPTALTIILGSPPPSFSSLDYFPLIPWFGVILVGTALGHFLSIHTINWRTRYSIFNFQFSIFNFAGRHSLAIYLIHQPILLSMMIVLLGPPQPLTLTLSRGERESQPLLVIEEDVELQNDENKPPKL